MFCLDVDKKSSLPFLASAAASAAAVSPRELRVAAALPAFAGWALRRLEVYNLGLGFRS